MAMTVGNKSIIRYAILVVFIHIAITVVHGILHQQVGVTLSSFQYSYVLVVTLVVPAASVPMLFVKNTNFQRVGAWLMVASMFGSLVFGVFYHTLVPGSDNIFSVMHGQWGVAFRSTAILLAIVDGAGCWVGLRVLKIQDDS
jgi:hypothetical protein